MTGVGDGDGGVAGDGGGSTDGEESSRTEALVASVGSPD